MPERIEDVALLIAGHRWRAWESIEIRTLLDGFRTVTFTAPYEPERREFRDAFQPFSFKDLDVYVEEQRLFAGTLVGVDPDVGSGRSVDGSAYSKPGVLNDVTPPSSAWPLELNGLGLGRIAETLVGPFGLSVVVDDGVEGAPFRRVAMKPDEAILGFVTKLAHERGLIVTDTEFGALRFRRSPSAGQPVTSFAEGQPPLLAVSSAFDPQSYYSEITALAKTRAGRDGGKFTVQNPWLTNVLRPLTFTLDDTDAADAPTAARAKLGRMFGNALQVQLELPTWRDPSGALWEPGKSVLLEAPGAMIFRETELLIREVTLRQDAKAISSTLGVVLPGAFSGEVPESLPWEAR